MAGVILGQADQTKLNTWIAAELAKYNHCDTSNLIPYIAAICLKDKDYITNALQEFLGEETNGFVSGLVEYRDGLGATERRDKERKDRKKKDRHKSHKKRPRHESEERHRDGGRDRDRDRRDRDDAKRRRRYSPSNGERDRSRDRDRDRHSSRSHHHHRDRPREIEEDAVVVAAEGGTSFMDMGSKPPKPYQPENPGIDEPPPPLPVPALQPPPGAPPPLATPLGQPPRPHVAGRSIPGLAIHPHHPHQQIHIQRGPPLPPGMALAPGPGMGPPRVLARHPHNMPAAPLPMHAIQQQIIPVGVPPPPLPIVQQQPPPRPPPGVALPSSMKFAPKPRPKPNPGDGGGEQGKEKPADAPKRASFQLCKIPIYLNNILSIQSWFRQFGPLSAVECNEETRTATITSDAAAVARWQESGRAPFDKPNIIVSMAPPPRTEPASTIIGGDGKPITTTKRSTAPGAEEALAGWEKAVEAEKLKQQKAELQRKMEDLIIQKGGPDAEPILEKRRAAKEAEERKVAAERVEEEKQKQMELAQRRALRQADPIGTQKELLQLIDKKISNIQQQLAALTTEIPKFKELPEGKEKKQKQTSLLARLKLSKEALAAAVQSRTDTEQKLKQLEDELREKQQKQQELLRKRREEQNAKWSTPTKPTLDSALDGTSNAGTDDTLVKNSSVAMSEHADSVVLYVLQPPWHEEEDVRMHFIGSSHNPMTVMLHDNYVELHFASAEECRKAFLGARWLNDKEKTELNFTYEKPEEEKDLEKKEEEEGAHDESKGEEDLGGIFNEEE
eukprot:TRINITY_DN57210_c0_g1_i1.p1 TRINITY_DN57210_c0_g1~~TRINITY_DN57210_c0_g1_i1.p1  ORF type:complete len:787 (-),score=116.29 TRINITY_DN57210_c0_g1_i1:76-2436(-)